MKTNLCMYELMFEFIDFQSNSNVMLDKALGLIISYFPLIFNKA